MTTVEPIGIIRSPLSSPSACPRQGVEDDIRGTIELTPAFADGLVGIDPGDRLVVVWFADRAERDRVQFDRNGTRGVFATRSQDRPNPICLTTVEVQAVSPPTLSVVGLDMVDTTPVLDLKPALDY